MQNSKLTTSKPQKIGILLFDDFSNHCLANTVEPLRAANSLARQTHYEWQFLTLDGAPVHSSSGMQVAPHASLSNTSGSALFVMPSYGFRDLESWPLTKALRAAALRYDSLAGLDTGSWLLAHAGLLDGRRATIHWDELDSFAEQFPSINTQRERFIIDGDRITCSGAAAAFDLVIHMMSKAHGPFLAIEVAQLFMTRETTSPPDTGTFTNLMGQEKTVNKALSIMQENLETLLPIADIALRVGVTQKTLENRMQKHLNATPQALYRQLRLNFARKLIVGTDHSIAEISGRCGYQNASAMTRAFKSVFHTTPKELRGF